MPPNPRAHRWKIAYSDAQSYDLFSSYPFQIHPAAYVAQRFDLSGAVVADVGSGSGRSTFELTKTARRVIGIEPEPGMREFATRRARELGISNVAFVGGVGQTLPLTSDGVDVLVACTAARSAGTVEAFVRQAKRVVRPGGIIASVDVLPDHCGGSLHHHMDHSDHDSGNATETAFINAGFDYLDFQSMQDFGTVENMAASFSDIFGEYAAAQVREHGFTNVTWQYRLHAMRVDDPGPIFGQFMGAAADRVHTPESSSELGIATVLI